MYPFEGRGAADCLAVGGRSLLCRAMTTCVRHGPLSRSNLVRTSSFHLVRTRCKRVRAESGRFAVAACFEGTPAKGCAGSQQALITGVLRVVLTPPDLRDLVHPGVRSEHPGDWGRYA